FVKAICGSDDADVSASLRYLSPETRHFLQLASVFGSSFRIGDLAAFADRSLPDLVDPVEEALHAGLLADDETHLQFRHEVVRTCLYEEMAPSVLAALHGRAGAVLSEAGASPGTVGWHLGRAARPGDQAGLDLLIRTARAHRMRDPKIALPLYEPALDLVDSDHPRYGEVMAGMAWPLTQLGRQDEASRIATERMASERDRQLSQWLRMALLQGLLVQGPADAHRDTARGFAALSRLRAIDRAWLHSHEAAGRLGTGDLAGANELAATVLATAESAGDTGLAVHALQTLAWGATAEGWVDKA